MAQLTATQQPPRSLSSLTAWRNVLGITLFGWLLLALPNFGFLTDYLAKNMRNDAVLAAFLLDTGFAVSALIIVGLLIWWQRIHGETLADIGWRRPTTVTALLVGVIYGLLWTALSYANVRFPHGSFLEITWERLLMMPIGVLLAFTEELMFRGFLMEQLRRASVPTWLQVIASGVCIASYHGLIGWHYSFFYATFSIPLFAILALIHVLGKRSMTPNTIAHALVHILGDPFLTMGILFGAIALGKGF